MNEIALAPLTPAPLAAQPDLVALLLEDKRSECTKRAYASDLAQFFGCPGQTVPSHIVARFVALPAPEIALALARYKSSMRAEGLAEATINRRLAAVKSLLKFAHRLGYAQTDGRGLVDGEKVTQYRDTRGVDLETLRRLMRLPDELFSPREEAKCSGGSRIYSDIPTHPFNNVSFYTGGSSRRELRRLRDLAILRLLIENALRRAEVCRLGVSDFEPAGRSLWILGKGRGSQRERISLSLQSVGALEMYLLAAGHKEGALFRALDNAHLGQPLTADGLYHLIGFYGQAAGLQRLTPHQLRHSSITAALDATGDVRKVQRLSRHRKLDVLIRYDDNRQDLQGEVSSLLSGLLDEPKKKRGR